MVVKALLPLILAIAPLSLTECGIAQCKGPELPEAQEELLSHYKILFYHGLLMISPELISDCVQRSEASVLLSHAIFGNGLTATDEQFAAKNPKLLSTLVRTVWGAIANSPAVPSDGTLRHDRWAILRNPNVDGSVVAEIALSSIHSGGFGPDVTYLLLCRPLPELSTTAKEELAAPKAPVTSKIFALAFLSKISVIEAKEASDKLSASSSLTSEQAMVLKQLTNRFGRNEAATWDDIAPLAIEEI